jgi:hypothetical protein
VLKKDFRIYLCELFTLCALKKILGFIYVNYLPCVLREKKMKMKMKMKLYSWVEMLKVYALKWKLVL